jgi:LacI family transcriptional regulator
MNLEEVARQAKVSTATVSRVLNDVAVVSDSTRARVMKVIAELKYSPNLHARSLAAGKSKTFGILVSNLENPFFFDVAHKIEAEAHSRGYEIVVANTNYEAAQLVKSTRLMMGRRVAGLAAIVSEIDPDIIEELAATKFPVVFYDLATPRRNITTIRTNYRQGMQRVAEYLYSLGHDRRLAWIGHHLEFAPLAERHDSLIAAVQQLAPGADVRTYIGTDTLEGGWRAGQEILASGFRPTAVVCANDFMAVGALRAFRESGLSVPEDVSVTGLDNIQLTEYCYPQLTTVSVPRAQIGSMIFEELINGSEQGIPHGDDLLIEPELIIRASTGPAKRD